jgi:hypothetical protein
MSVSSSFVLSPLLSLSVEPILRRAGGPGASDDPDDPQMTILEDPFRTTYYQTPTKPGELLK